MKYRTSIDIGLLFCVSLILSFLMFRHGFPVGYDYKNLLIAYEEVAHQIVNGELYPRWLYDTNRGFGSANLFFYPPFTYYTAFFIDTLSGYILDTTTLMIINSTLLVFLSGITFYIFASPLTNNNFSVIASGIYMILPYHSWFEIYERNAIAELSAYIWIPLIFHYSRISAHNTAYFSIKLSLCYALLVLSHLPTAVFISFFIPLYLTFNLKYSHSFESWIKDTFYKGAAYITGLLISALYLYPAISMLDLANTDYLWRGFYDYQLWFLWFDHSCPIDEACNKLWIIALLQITVPLILMVILRWKTKRKHNIQGYEFLGLALVCFFMMTPLSSFIWSVIPPLQKIQFPWRLLVLSDFLFTASTMMFLYQLSKDRNPKSVLICAIMTAIPFTFVTYKIADYTKNSWAPPLHKFEDSIAKKMLTEEHIPNNPSLSMSYKDIQTAKPYPEYSVIAGDATITAERQNARHILFSIDAKTPSVLHYRQFYFTGWRLFKDGEDVTAQFDLKDAGPYGQIQISLPKGAYMLELKLSLLPQERIGLFISMIGIAILLLNALKGMHTRILKRP